MLRSLAVVFWLLLSYFASIAQAQAPLVNEPPKDVSVPNIIQSFAAKENDFKQAHEQYSFTRNVTVNASCHGGQPGVYHLSVDIVFDRKNNRTENVKAADSTLECIAITKDDLDRFRNQSLFLVTTQEIINYQITFVGQQQQEDLHFYVFDVSPISNQTGNPQFEGRIWVDSRDFAIVKSQGRVLTKRDKKRKEKENPLSAFTTWRQQIDGRFWFPTYSRADDVIHSGSGDVQIEEVVKITNYKAVTNSR